jgi:hypothetical protein
VVLTQAGALLAALTGTSERADALRTASRNHMATDLMKHRYQLN